MSQHASDINSSSGSEHAGFIGLPSTGQVLGKDGLLAAFESATGWKLRPECVGQPSAAPVLLDSAPVANPIGDSRPSPAVARIAPAVARPRVVQARAERLAEELCVLLEELEVTRRTLWKREAELAASVPVRQRPDESLHLAERLEAVLKGAAEALACDALGVYLLDDATSELKLRACWGMPRSKLLEPARPLRGAIADLEALLGHAVVIEETALLPHWKVPESFASAACVPIASPTEPLGTLWAFSSKTRDLTPAQTNLLEIIAGRIASELQRDVLLGECTHSRQVESQIAAAVAWQQARLPRNLPFVEGWALAGFILPGEELTGMFHDWWISSDGTLTLATGGGGEGSISGGLACAELRGILYGVASANRDAMTTLEVVDEMLRNATPTAMESHLGVTRVASESGNANCSTAGNVAVWKVSTESSQCLWPETQTGYPAPPPRRLVPRLRPSQGEGDGGGACGVGGRSYPRLKSRRLKLFPGDALIMGLIESQTAHERTRIESLVAEAIREPGITLDEKMAMLRNKVAAEIPGIRASFVSAQRTESASAAKYAEPKSGGDCPPN